MKFDSDDDADSSQVEDRRGQSFGGPIMLGGGGPRMLRLAGREADLVSMVASLRAGEITSGSAAMTSATERSPRSTRRARRARRGYSAAQGALAERFGNWSATRIIPATSEAFAQQNDSYFVPFG